MGRTVPANGLRIRENAPNRDPISGSGHRIDIAVEFVEREGSCSRET
jgi:hypothetical protein